MCARFTFSVFATLLFCSCIHHGSHISSVGVHAYELSERARNDLAGRVSKGDADAAYQLAQYHLCVTLDLQKGLAWLKRGAELGSVDAQYSYAFYIKDDPARLLEAKHWLKIAAAKKCPEAISLLEELSK